MLDASGEFLYYVFKYGIIVISIIGILRLWISRNDKRKHLLTKVITILFSLFAIYLFVGEYIEHSNKMKELAGDYGVKKFECDECIQCTMILETDGTYHVKQADKKIDSGNWNFKEIEFGGINFVFDDQETYGIESESKKIMFYVKSINCLGSKTNE